MYFLVNPNMRIGLLRGDLLALHSEDQSVAITFDILRVLNKLKSGFSLKKSLNMLGGLSDKDSLGIFKKLEKLGHLVPLAEVKKDFCFVQIGSNDGAQGDPIHNLVVNNLWNGILIEPVPYLYQRLKRNYSKLNHLIFENVAIDIKEGTRPFYRIKENKQKNNPFWYDQLGSFRPDVVLKHKKAIPNFSKYFVKEEIRCTTLQSILEKHEFGEIDLLHIDTEGYDFEIIKSIDFKNKRPKNLLYEEKHLSTQDKKRCRGFLSRRHYRVSDCYGDVIAHSTI